MQGNVMRSSITGLVVSMVLLLAVQFPASARIWDSVPDEQLSALKLSRDATPKELFDAVAERYRAELTKGKLAKWWEPIPMDQYYAPTLFYKPPALDLQVSRDQCIACHTGVTHGWVVSWQKSVHANLDSIRALPDSDVRGYKKDIIKEVEGNLQSQSLLAQGKALKDVSCIDCHMGVGKAEGNHATDLRLPDRAVCGTCHVRQFAEAESERDTLIWPQKQWPNGHPSHAVDFMATVELATWAAMENREAASACVLCHVNQTKCDTCHTRHQFSTVDSRKPQACATCHNGVDHNEFEQYLLSKHGTVYQTLGHEWNWDARLADAQDKGGMTAPTCQFCHFEYKGEFTHNLVRKVRWGFLPLKEIADNLDDPWFKERKTQWQGTCSHCHSPRFAATYLDMIDTGVKQGTDIVEATRKVVQKLYDDKLMVGQKTNRPAPPEPEKDAAGGFYSLFISKGNNPTMVDRTFTEMWEQHVTQYMKGLQHVNPGGWSYTGGWSPLIKDQIFINEQDTKLREMAGLKDRVDKLEGNRTGSAKDHPASTNDKPSGANDKPAGTSNPQQGEKTTGFDNRGGASLALWSLDRRSASGALALLGGGLVFGGLISLRRKPPDDEPEPQ